MAIMSSFSQTEEVKNLKDKVEFFEGFHRNISRQRRLKAFDILQKNVARNLTQSKSRNSKPSKHREE